MGAHFAVSSAIRLASSSAVLPTGSSPAARSCLLTSVDRIAAAIAADKRSTIGRGVPAVVWNRVHAIPQPLPAEPPVRQFVAAAATPPPVGTRRLLAWYDEWGVLEHDA